MAFLAFCARITLSLVLAVAGATKLLDIDRFRKAVTDFGVPVKIAPALATLLPWLEIGVAVALIPISSVWIASWMALLLLLAFSIAIGVNLATGRTPECHCFGQLQSTPIGWSTLARNGILSGLAVLIII